MHSHSQTDIERVASALLESVDLQLVSCRILQRLWAGYGHICAVTASSPLGNDDVHLILKYISPPTKTSSSTSSTSSSQTGGDEGHLRKILSYQVEQRFYSQLAPVMPKNIAVASCLASVDSYNRSESRHTTAMLLQDLRRDFPLAGERQNKNQMSQTQVHAIVDWLAAFHGFWWSRTDMLPRAKLLRPPLEEKHRISPSNTTVTSDTGTVWLNGGYTYLATRRREYSDLMHDSTSEWSSKLCRPLSEGGETLAERVARFLSPSVERQSPNTTTSSTSSNRSSTMTDYETLIHGDVKSENLFTTLAGDAVAFYDFQYVGLGLGVCDIAKLFTCSLPEGMLAESVSANGGAGSMCSAEEHLLRRYLKVVQETSGKKNYEWHTFIRHWETALVDWLRFQASWGFWGNTEWLEARVRTIVQDENWRSWLDESVSHVVDHEH